MIEDLEVFIRDVPDFPRAGIVFKDITPLLLDAPAFAQAVAQMAAAWAGVGITKVVAIESRGFLFGGPIAVQLGAGLVPVRKPGKLPSATGRIEYALEYGTDALEMHSDALGAHDQVLVVDDVLATGGTAQAAGDLVKQHGATVAGFSFLVELAFLSGRRRLAERVEALLRYA